MEDSADTGQSTNLDENLKPAAAGISPQIPILPICLVTLHTPAISQEPSTQPSTPTGRKRTFEEAAADSVDEPCDENEQEPESVSTNAEGEAASIVDAVTVLQRLQREADESDGPATVQKSDLDQILRGFAKALEATRPSLDDRGVEKQMQSLFVSHAHVFDENMQSFIIQNFIPESDCTKKIRTALRRTSLVRRCIRAMTPATRTTTAENDGQPLVAPTSDSATRWNTALARRVLAAAEKRPSLLDVSSAGADPKIVQAGQQEMEKIDTWTFDIFAVAQAAPAQVLTVVGMALLEKYEFCSHFRSSKSRLQGFLQQYVPNQKLSCLLVITWGSQLQTLARLHFDHRVQLAYHSHPYHNAIHAADVAQTLHHFLSVGKLGESLPVRTKNATIIAALVHDMGHTSFTNNFHISVNDDLAIQYVYRSPLEHMHCALAFQLLKNPNFNILQGLTKVEQSEFRNLITDMVLATDNSVHSVYLVKLEALVRRTSADPEWRLSDPDDERLLLQMALHTADVSNPAKSFDLYKVWMDRIREEFYHQGDKERELELPISIGTDRHNPIPREKLQAGFIIGIVRPLFQTMSQVPNAQLSHCMDQLDANLVYWQDEIRRNQPDSQ